MKKDKKKDNFEVDKPNLNLENSTLNEMSKYAVRGLSKLAAGRVQRAKIAGGLLGGIVLLFVSLFTMTALLDKENKFQVNASDPGNIGIALSEVGDFANEGAYGSKLSAESLPAMFNIDGSTDIPADVNDHDGNHSGVNYLAYTFYLANTSTKNVVVNINEHIDVEVNTLGMADAVRIRVYKTVYKKNDKENIVEGPLLKTYAKAKENGEPEYILGEKKVLGVKELTVPFVSQDMVLSEDFTLDTKTMIKYTIVFWLEGWDKECVNSVIGGSFGISINFDVTDSE